MRIEHHFVFDNNLNNYTLMSKEKYVDGKKHLFYQVIPQQVTITTPTKKDNGVTITFD